jgi:hypothetical protein
MNRFVLLARLAPLGAALLGLAVLALAARAVDAQVSIPDAPTCPTCAIDVRVSMRFGAEDGPAALPQNAGRIAVDSRGRYWLFFFSTPPLIFDRDGRFVQAVGRKGAGPGEFQYPRTGVAVGDSVVVFDLNRAVVFGPDLQLVRSIRTPTDSRQIAALRWPTNVLFNAEIGRARTGVWPMHLLQMSGAQAEVVRSFGVGSTPFFSDDSLDLVQHRFSNIEAGTVWSVEHVRYRLTRWDETGKVLASFARSPSWLPGVSSSSPGGPNRAPSSAIDAITTDANGYVWVFTRVGKSTWREAWVEVRRRTGPLPARGESSEGVPEMSALYETIVEVIDPATARVVARRTVDRLFLGTVDRGRVISSAETAAGAPIVEIVSVELRRPPG